MNSAFFVAHRFSPGAVLGPRSTAVSVFSVLAIGFSLPAVGQTSANGAIRGYVRDPTGAVLPGTAITVISSTAPTPSAVVSDEGGYYRLLELPPGEYQLIPERLRFAKFAGPGIVVRAGCHVAVEIC